MAEDVGGYTDLVVKFNFVTKSHVEGIADHVGRPAVPRRRRAANHRFPSFSRLSETYHFLIQNLSIRLISALGVPRSRFAFLDTVEKVRKYKCFRPR